MAGIGIQIRGDKSLEAAFLRIGKGGVRRVGSQAVTILAKDFAAEVEFALPGIFDRPTPFTGRSSSYDKAGSKPRARSYIRPRQSRYLQIQEEGGHRDKGDVTPYGGKLRPLTILDRSIANQYGNLRKGYMRNKISGSPQGKGARPGTKVYFSPRKGIKFDSSDDPKFGIFVRTKLSKRKRRKASKAINELDRKLAATGGYRRAGNPAKKRGNQSWALRMLIRFEDKADYEPIFKYHDEAVEYGRRRGAKLASRLIQAELKRQLSGGISGSR